MIIPISFLLLGHCPPGLVGAFTVADSGDSANPDSALLVPMRSTQGESEPDLSSVYNGKVVLDEILQIERISPSGLDCLFVNKKTGEATWYKLRQVLIT